MFSKSRCSLAATAASLVTFNFTPGQHLVAWRILRLSMSAFLPKKKKKKKKKKKNRSSFHHRRRFWDLRSRKISSQLDQFLNRAWPSLHSWALRLPWHIHRRLHRIAHNAVRNESSLLRHRRDAALRVVQSVRRRAVSFVTMATRPLRRRPAARMSAPKAAPRRDINGCIFSINPPDRPSAPILLDRKEHNCNLTLRLTNSASSFTGRGVVSWR